MAPLFPREQNHYDAEFGGSDVATRALSAISLETSSVEGVYGKMASVYDLFFGLPLHHGRAVAINRMAISPDDHILEVGVGTGMSLPLYPRKCSVTAVDLSDSMLERARARVLRYKLHNVRLIQMDATELRFPDNSFDIVYAPYFISCVPDPIAVTREMRRVCRPNGRIVFLNHFLSDGPILSKLERAIAPITLHLGFKSDFDLPAFLAQTGLRAESIDKVNLPRIWSLLVCRNGQTNGQ
jgi:phosphatidylethanolamine/phosphatidyl-N-methylethanolamine N-methyltransferase